MRRLLGWLPGSQYQQYNLYKKRESRHHTHTTVPNEDISSNNSSNNSNEPYRKVWYLWLIIMIVMGYFVMFVCDLWKYMIKTHTIDHDYNSYFSNNKINANDNKNPLTFWSSDFHISPIADIKTILQSSNHNHNHKHIHDDYGRIHIIDKSLSGHCHLSNTCERDLRVLTKFNGIRLEPCTNDIIREFYSSYRNDPEMNKVDGFFCTHATSLCELYMPFNKSLIAIASTRFEIGRHDAVRWQQWVNNLERIAQSPCNIVGANNKYDQEYIKYFTNIQNVLLLPNLCSYVTDRYKPMMPQVLLAPARGINSVIADQLQSFVRKQNRSHKSSNSSQNKQLRRENNDAEYFLRDGDISIAHIRDLYPHFEYSDLVRHPAIILLPYQVSFMSFFEFYRMEIPMFAPSPELLTKWHLEHRILNERTWSSVFGMPSGSSLLPKHPQSTCLLEDDPNNGRAVLEWVSLADFYQWPHIQLFNGWEDLFNQLTSVDLRKISINMRIYNEQDSARIHKQWSEIMRVINHCRVSSRSSADGTIMYNETMLPKDPNEVLISQYGFKLSPGCTANIEIEPSSQK